MTRREDQLCEKTDSEESQNGEVLRKRKSRKKPEPDPLKVKLTVGQLIGIERRKQGLSQEEVSWHYGISRSQVGRIERDESEPSVRTIEGLEEALGLELYDLFMAQKRERERKKKNQKKPRIPTETLGQFGKELASKGLSSDELKDVLNEALKSADSKTKKEK